MLEHAVWFNLVQWRLKQTFLIKLVIIVVSKGAELLCLENTVNVILSKPKSTILLTSWFKKSR